MNQSALNTKNLYDELQFGNFSYGRKREIYDALLIKFLKRISTNHKLFDIGCGGGYYMQTYHDYGIKKEQITALDIGPSNIERLKEFGYKAICGDVLKLPLEDKISDFTICQGVIHHTENPKQAFSELVRITKLDGFIYLNVYNKWHPFFYIVHKLTTPLRFIYWNITSKISDFLFPICKPFIQLISLFLFGENPDRQTSIQHFKDQILTTRAHLLSKSDIKKLAKENNCKVEELQYNRYCTMIAALIKCN